MKVYIIFFEDCVWGGKTYENENNLSTFATKGLAVERMREIYDALCSRLKPDHHEFKGSTFDLWGDCVTLDCIHVYVEEEEVIGFNKNGK